MKAFYSRWGTLGAILALALWFIWEAVKEAFFGWLNSQIIKMLDIDDFSIQQAYPLLTTYLPVGIAAAIALVVVWLAFRLGRGFHKTKTIPTALLPDWPMKELFLYLQETLDDPNGDLREIETKAGLGILKCWGRKYPPMDIRPNPNPPMEIPTNHWQEYTLDYLNCMQHTDPAECCTMPRKLRGDNRKSFQDLKVNQQQAMTIWPPKVE